MAAYERTLGKHLFSPVIKPKGKWSTVPFLPLSIKGFFREKLPKYPRVSCFNGSFGQLENPYNEYRKKEFENGIV
ncbi:MAG: hypothetical protein PHI97_22005 [Desulfobulbus sp.]|nr:hypothetical protein [Desulfobulbus sp.]